jgi:hypothetical protein
MLTRGADNNNYAGLYTVTKDKDYTVVLFGDLFDK